MDQANGHFPGAVAAIQLLQHFYLILSIYLTIWPSHLKTVDVITELSLTIPALATGLSLTIPALATELSLTFSALAIEHSAATVTDQFIMHCPSSSCCPTITVRLARLDSF